ncbi:MAG: hypothetical protein ACK4SZ_16225 [Allosphingosinicella sp.]|uniref:hypothetical protein n=1 Tax=Allosphingosinicella sp. TaxID=2823234 RepID=UPI0039615C0A
MPLFRVRTIPGAPAGKRELRTDIAVEAADLTLAREKADLIARSVVTWHDGDRIEILGEEEELLATRRSGRSWRTFRHSSIEVDHSGRRAEGA